MRVIYRLGDITDSITEAIVNAANPTLKGGGGVGGAIHRAAGPDLLQACLQAPQLEPNVRCRVGKTVVTPAFDLETKYVIHTVGPIYPAGRDAKFPGEQKFTVPGTADTMLKLCIHNCLREARKLHVNSIAFPAISCGFYGCSPITFGRIARKVTSKADWEVAKVEFVLFNQDEYDQFVAGWSGEPQV